MISEDYQHLLILLFIELIPNLMLTNCLGKVVEMLVYKWMLMTFFFLLNDFHLYSKIKIIHIQTKIHIPINDSKGICTYMYNIKHNLLWEVKFLEKKTNN